MKKSFLYSACAAALLAATPALAVVAPSGSNSSTVTQAGDTESATVNQNGANDVSTIDQIAAPRTTTRPP